ncbi:MAG: hypothetical protein IJ500_01830 [Alphaproteobacteria bacterium]|nr:hypothetical protein [Alphaproteobacteria bacterium]
MKKSLLFSLLTVCAINSALAENIQNLDTPVNWSYSAIFNTIFDLYDDNPLTYYAGYTVANRVYISYVYENKPVSARWICDKYNEFAREERALFAPVDPQQFKIHNCYDIIEKIISTHNNQVQSQQIIKPIDKYMPDKKVYWISFAVEQACLKVYLINNLDMDESERCVNLGYDKKLHTKPYSINELFDDCVKNTSLPSGADITQICSSFTDYAIEEHNKRIRQTENISGTIK